MIKTGYFAQHRKYKEAGYIMVGITRFPPKWFDGLNLIELSPSAETLTNYRHGRISWEQFEEDYLEYLKNNSELVLKTIENLKSCNLGDIVLCCFEKSGEPCHRNILAKFLNENYGFEILEFSH